MKRYYAVIDPEKKRKGVEGIIKDILNSDYDEEEKREQLVRLGRQVDFNNVQLANIGVNKYILQNQPDIVKIMEESGEQFRKEVDLDKFGEYLEIKYKSDLEEIAESIQNVEDKHRIMAKLLKVLIKAMSMESNSGYNRAVMGVDLATELLSDKYREDYRLDIE